MAPRGSRKNQRVQGSTTTPAPPPAPPVQPAAGPSRFDTRGQGVVGPQGPLYTGNAGHPSVEHFQPRPFQSGSQNTFASNIPGGDSGGGNLFDAQNDARTNQRIPFYPGAVPPNYLSAGQNIPQHIHPPAAMQTQGTRTGARANAYPFRMNATPGPSHCQPSFSFSPAEMPWQQHAQQEEYKRNLALQMQMSGQVQPQQPPLPPHINAAPASVPPLSVPSSSYPPQRAPAQFLGLPLMPTTREDAHRMLMEDRDLSHRMIPEIIQGTALGMFYLQHHGHEVVLRAFAFNPEVSDQIRTFAQRMLLMVRRLPVVGQPVARNAEREPEREPERAADGPDSQNASLDKGKERAANLEAPATSAVVSGSGEIQPQRGMAGPVPPCPGRLHANATTAPATPTPAIHAQTHTIPRTSSAASVSQDGSAGSTTSQTYSKSMPAPPRPPSRQPHMFPPALPVPVPQAAFSPADGRRAYQNTSLPTGSTASTSGESVTQNVSVVPSHPLPPTNSATPSPSNFYPTPPRIIAGLPSSHPAVRAPFRATARASPQSSATAAVKPRSPAHDEAIQLYHPYPPQQTTAIVPTRHQPGPAHNPGTSQSAMGTTERMASASSGGTPAVYPGPRELLAAHYSTTAPGKRKLDAEEAAEVPRRRKQFTPAYDKPEEITPSSVKAVAGPSEESRPAPPEEPQPSALQPTEDSVFNHVLQESTNATDVRKTTEEAEKQRDSGADGKEATGENVPIDQVPAHETAEVAQVVTQSMEYGIDELFEFFRKEMPGDNPDLQNLNGLSDWNQYM